MIFQDFQPIAAIATTPAAIKQLQRLPQLGKVWVPRAIVDSIQPPQLSSTATQQSRQLESYSGSLKDQVAQLWPAHRSFVFCLATGAVVRLLAPLLQDKATDPAVVVVDEAGKFVISLCGGHQGGADQLTRLIAQQLGATPILTGSANHTGLPGIDLLGIPFGWSKGEGNWTEVSAAIARGETIQVIQEAGSTLWQQHLPAGHPFKIRGQESGVRSQKSEDREHSPLKPGTWNLKPVSLEDKQAEDAITSQASVWISCHTANLDTTFPQIQWHPRVLWVGIGCERGTSKTVIAQAIQQVFQAHHLAEGAIAGIATIDLKADEVGLLEFCRDLHLPLRCFSAEALRSVPVPTPSTVVASEVGTPSVAEAAAILASQTEKSETPFPTSPPLCITKQIFRLDGQPGAVTIAVAQANQESTGRCGKLWLVGIGPGELEQITPAAQGAIAQADAVIGYSLYIDLIQPLLRPGQIVEALPITQERQRAERAIALAQWGLTVAVISSGDCGIYGMAGLVLEQLRAQDWDGKTPQVQVFPGITALQAAASRVGAPLMHDFCAISLSDLLTPWEVIEKRLTAVAQADFVVALYNPKSKTRTEQIAIAQQIFLQWRHPETPVAVVRSAYRPDEQVMITTLQQLLETPIDMLTVILIGNQSSLTYADWIITPRGYLGFSGAGVRSEE